MTLVLGEWLVTSADRANTGQGRYYAWNIAIAYEDFARHEHELTPVALGWPPSRDPC